MQPRHYKHYVDLSYKPSKQDLICKFHLRTRQDLKEAAGAVAAESSIGTWTETTTVKPYMLKYAATVYKIKKLSKETAIIEIAYPLDLWELGNMPGLLSGIAGNIFGMKEIECLKLIDVTFPLKFAKSFPGPKYGISGIRKLLKVKNRPLLGTIIKPKIGLNSKDHAKVAYKAWIGGCDIVKDDENLVNQNFNKFESRLRETLKVKEKAEKETGEKKIYMINVTAETNEMLRRAKLVEDYGNEYLMVDIIVTGWAALQTLRNQDFNLVMHAHRAGHAALDRKDHGIAMNVIAKFTRLIGLDQLHVGTVVGKMFEHKEEVIQNIEALIGKFDHVRPLLKLTHHPGKYPGHIPAIKTLTGRLYHIKPTMPVSSGGLHPGHVPALYRIFGKDVVIQMGGGIHGHPLGTEAGARAARQAVEATVKGISLKEYAKTHKELAIALEHWK